MSGIGSNTSRNSQSVQASRISITAYHWQSVSIRLANHTLSQLESSRKSANFRRYLTFKRSNYNDENVKAICTTLSSPSNMLFLPYVWGNLISSHPIFLTSLLLLLHGVKVVAQAQFTSTPFTPSAIPLAVVHPYLSSWMLNGSVPLPQDWPKFSTNNVSLDLQAWPTQ